MRGPAIFRKTRLHLTMIYSVFIGLTLVMMAAVFYFLLVHSINEKTTSSLKNANSRAIEHLFNKRVEWLDIRTGERIHLGFEYIVDWSFMSLEEFVLITKFGGEPLYLSLNTDRNPNELYQWMEQDIARWNAQDGNQDKRASQQFSHSSSGGNTYVTLVTPIDDIGYGFKFLYLGKDTTDDTRVLRQMRTILIVLGAGLLLLASLLGHLFAGKAIVPITKAFNRLRDFTADASHELRTPLTVLNSSVEIVQEHQDRLPTFHQEVLHSAKEEIGRMTVLVDNLLTLARSDSGVVELMHEPIDLVRILQQSVGTMHAAATSKEITVQVNVNASADETHLIGDRERLKQLVIILMDNAIKYNTLGGSVSLTVETDKAGIVLTVKDSGIGISRAELPYIFGRFFRADKARSRDLGGTGLGLAIADWIVKAHHGSLTAESELGQGSRFTVRLPAGS